MTDNTEAQICHVYERWHESIKVRDLDGLMALYAEDAVFETPFILVVHKDKTEGVLKGKADIRSFFAAGFLNPRAALAAGVAPAPSSPTAASWSGNIRVKRRRATRSTSSK